MRIRYKFDSKITRSLVALRKLDNWHCFIGLLYDYSVIAIAILLFSLQPSLYPISIILIGSRQRALATLLHEAAHFSLAKSRKLNKFIGMYLTGFLIFQEFNLYHASHVKNHHAYLGDKTKDPDYQYHIKQNLYSHSSSLKFFLNYILKPLLLLNIISYIHYLIIHRMSPTKNNLKNYLKMLTLWFAIFIIFLHYHLVTDLIVLWFIPLVTTSAIFGWFNELSEHYPLIGNNNLDLYMSRNRFSHWFEHLLFNTHNENYHLVHHLNPSIPYWNLKLAHKIMCQDEAYKKFNIDMGGIFVSNNGNPSLISKLLQKPVINLKGQIQYE